MFEFFKRKIHKDNKVNKNEKTNILDEEKILDVSFEDNVTKINILKDCSSIQLTETFNKLNVEEPKIPMRMYIKKDNNEFEAQNILIYDCDTKTYIFSINNSKLKISQRKLVDDKIEEIVVYIDKRTEKYKIIKYVHNLDHSTIFIKWYPQNDEKNKMFTLDKVEAFSSMYRLVDDMEKDGASKFTNIEQICRILNLVEDYKYFPVIKDDMITLSWPCRFGETDINKRKYEFFDIILNDTKQVIGQISFDYQTAEGFTYEGNVSYNIKDEFRGNHYATRALALLKKLLKQNLFDGDKDLYVSTKPDNYKSQKVTINNNGELVYKGSVPEDDSLSYIDGVKKVNIYKIKM